MRSTEAAASAAPASTTPTKRSLTLPQALELAVELVREEQVEDAERLLLKILEHNHEQPDALHFLGVLRHTQGRSEEAVALIRRAIELLPNESGPWNNLGNVLVETQRLDEAVEAYECSVALAGSSPASADAYNNLGTIYRKRDQWLDSERACRRAVEVRPDFGNAWYNLSLALMGQGRINDGLIANSKAIALWPRHLQARDQVIRALVLLGEREQAARLYGEWLDEEPDNPVARHQLAACLGQDAPERASDAYVELVFDSFATTFDAKLEQLHYRAPQLVASALQLSVGEARGALQIMDAGCGTGLCGMLVRPWARQLWGCDLSAAMLERARARGCYDQLEKAELTACLAAHGAAFDAIVCADTLVYFGALERVMLAASEALKAGGRFLFTVEDGDGIAPEAGFALNPNGRYCHTQGYIDTAIEAVGLQPEMATGVELRFEAGLPVKGLLVVAGKR